MTVYYKHHPPDNTIIAIALTKLVTATDMRASWKFVVYFNCLKNTTPIVIVTNGAQCAIAKDFVAAMILVERK